MNPLGIGPGNRSGPSRGAILLAAALCLIYLPRPIEWVPRSGLTFLVVTAVLQVLLLIVPLMTRDRREPGWYRRPTFRRLRIELGVAILALIGFLVVFSIAEMVVQEFSPGTTLASGRVEGMTRWPPRYLISLLVFGFTFVPIAEEVFFRGFLYNLFRKRMPVVMAIVFQAVLFGAGHSYDLQHSIGAAALGVTLGLLYEWRKTLLTPILMHMLMNFLAALYAITMMAQTAEQPMIGIHFDYEADGCIVQEVIPGSGAAKARLQPGDRIVQAAGYDIDSPKDLVNAIATKRAGEWVPIAILRDTERIEVSVETRRRGFAR